LWPGELQVSELLNFILIVFSLIFNTAQTLSNIAAWGQIRWLFLF